MLIRFGKAAVCACVAICFGLARPAASQTVQVGSASISNDPEAGTWRIASAGAALTLTIGPDRDFGISRLVSPSGQTHVVGPLSDTVLRVGGARLAFGSRSSGFVFQDVTTSVRGSTVRLDATFDLPGSRLRVTRHYAATSGSPTFETWTTFTPLGSPVTLSDLNAFRLTVRAGTIHWLNGLQGDDPNSHTDTAFIHQTAELSTGRALTLGAQGRSSEQTVPWIRIDSDGDQLYAGLLWSGAWSLSVARTDAGLDMTLGLAPMTTTTSAAVEGPHAFFGVVRGAAAQASSALQAFIIDGLRGGRPFKPLVTYNPWFVYGVWIDEASMLAEIDAAADLGVELFVLDAGWYVGTGRDGASDFASGLGTWQVDTARFPSGLRALTERAHARGMKFGIWVEPERVAQSVVSRQVPESWLAKTGGKYGATREAQICLASAAVRQWVSDQLTRLIDSVQPDYVKWDNNFWINCDRSGHGHGAADGNFAHVSGLYELLGALRARYPELLIENVSGGGNRLDFGMLRYSDVGWMDDRSAPSSVVRRNVEGLGVVFPPAYLLSFVMDHPDESIHDPADLALYFRSRMPATLGLCVRLHDFSEDQLAHMSDEIEIYKTIRGTLERAAGALLTDQASARGGPDWDIFQATTPRSRFAVLLAFQSEAGADTIVVRPVRLRPDFTYRVTSVDAGELGTASGEELMRDGIEIGRSFNSAAHVLTLSRTRR